MRISPALKNILYIIGYLIIGLAVATLVARHSAIVPPIH